MTGDIPLNKKTGKKGMKNISICALLFHITTFALSPEQQFAQAYELVNSGEYTDALQIYRELHAQFPGNIELLNNIGFVLKKQNKMSEAIEIYQKARANSQTINSRIERAISHAYLALGDFDHGWPAYEYRWVNPPPYNQELKKYIENGGSIQNKTILVHAEYGLGDTLQFIRYAQQLKAMGARIVLESQPSLTKLLSLCPYLDQVICAGQPMPAHDFQVQLMSLPLILQTKIKEIPAQIPYLFADKTIIETWKQKISKHNNLMIGICWQADVHKNSQYSVVNQDSVAKSIPLKLLSKISQLPNVSVYSLQKINGLEQIAELPKNIQVHHFDDLDTINGPFMDTAAIIQSLDLVITIDTSIAHLAGGLGIPTWILLPWHADWRWQINRSDSPWYPTMKLFRQDIQGYWEPVITNIMNDLMEQLKKKVDRQAFDSVCENLGLRAISNDELTDAHMFHKHILASDPQNAGALHNCGYILSRLNQCDTAVESYEKLLAIKPDSKGACLGLAKAYLAAGNFAKGWKQLEWRFPNPKEYQQAFGYLNVKPKDFKDKTILVRAEWGYGDMIQFIRYVSLIKEHGAKKVIIQIFEPLKKLFEISQIADQIIAVGDAIPYSDIHIPCMSLPMIFDTNIETIPAKIPYLKADEQLIKEWKNKLSNNDTLKIGICWRAKQIGFIEDFKYTRRSVPLESYVPICAQNNCTFYNLQKDATQEELQQLHDHHVITFGSDFDETHGRFMDSAALMMNLDLIITADTCTAHLAAALGKEVWILLPFSAEWRWLQQRTDTPWYPNNMKLFRQKIPGDWNSVIKEVKKALEQLQEQKRNICSQK